MGRQPLASDSGRLSLVVITLALAYALVGCSDSDIPEGVQGSWTINYLDQNVASTADLLCLTIGEQSVELTPAGGDVPTRGIVGGVFDEIEVTPLFAPEPSYAAELNITFVTGLTGKGGAKGIVFRALSLDQTMVGSATFMVDRGSKHLDPIPQAQEVRLFVGAKVPCPTVDPASAPLTRPSND